MAVPSSSKGKKRAHVEDQEISPSQSPTPLSGSNTPKVKKCMYSFVLFGYTFDTKILLAKRAETRICPVCDEVLPIRLLATHAELENQRLQTIFNLIGSTEVLYEEPDYGPGPSLRSGRSSQKARKVDKADILQDAEKTISSIKRHRKQRHAQFRDMGREDEKGKEKMSWADEIVCPVCLATLRGDQDVLDAHVDACLADESRRLEEERLRSLQQQEVEDDFWEESHPDGAAGHVGSVRGTGFHTRNRNEQDIEDEVDVDGDGEFGDAQFTEGDVMPISSSRVEVNGEVNVDIENDDDEDGAQGAEGTLQDLVAEGMVMRNASGSQVDETKASMEEVLGVGETEKMDLAILASRKRGDKASMITALENKVRQLAPAGVYAYFVFNVANLPDMHRPLQRTNGLNWLLAYLLSRMLASLSWLHKIMPHLQAYYWCIRFTENLPMTISKLLTIFLTIYLTTKMIALA
ncbi:hypothetical protein H0H93_006724 [Arthromyces matolae]|nr:hypothetical protein H0H93_006724 [Arthromyces matolae]